jgi:hypothetical protein
MVGAELHPATGSAIVVRQRARGEQRRRPAQTHLPPRTVVDLKRTKPDIPPTDIPPPRDSILTCRRGVGIGLKRVGSKRIEPLENWAWGLSLIALTMAIHGTGVIFMAFATLGIRVRLESQNRLELRRVFAINIGLIAAVGLLLAALHGIEAAVWAAAYWWLGALDSAAEALLYSVDSFTTRGASGLMLERHWRMMGALEATDGMLLFGISTAYIFTVMQDYWPLLTRLRPL